MNGAAVMASYSRQAARPMIAISRGHPAARRPRPAHFVEAADRLGSEYLGLRP